MSKSNAVTIRILDSEYRIACPPEEEEALLRAADYLDGKMRGIRENGKILGVERIAIMAALNISHEVLNQREEMVRTADVSNARVKEILAKVELTLSKTPRIG